MIEALEPHQNRKRGEDHSAPKHGIKKNGIVIMTEAEYKDAEREIFDYTGGSSLGGTFSCLWGFLGPETWKCLYGDAPLPDSSSIGTLVAQEAADFRRRFGSRLSERANALLLRISSLVPEEKSHRRHPQANVVVQQRTAQKQDRVSFIEKFRTNRDSTEAETAKQIVALAVEQGLTPGWMGSGILAFRPFMPCGRKKLWPLSLDTSGFLTIPMQQLTRHPPFNEATKRLELQERLMKIPCAKVAGGSPDGPINIPLRALVQIDSRNELLAMLRWLIEEIKQSAQITEPRTP